MVDGKIWNPSGGGMSGWDLVRAADVEWQPLGTHGLRCRTLRHYPATDGRINLVDIPKRWRGGGVAHFHYAFEEVYILTGSVTVGADRYFRTGDYFYRPAMVVHGHDERSEEGCLALIRSDGPLALNLVHSPAEEDEYPIGPISDPRGHILHLPTETVPWSHLPGFPPSWQARLLSENEATGETTVMVQVPAGAGENLASLESAIWTAYVISGAAELDGRAASAGDLASAAVGGGRTAGCGSAAGATLLIWCEPDARN